MESRDVVQGAIDAYHDHDLDRCLAFYAEDVVVKDVIGNVLSAGAEAVRSSYARAMSDNPRIHYDIPNRIAVGDVVVDEERVSGYSKPGSPELVRAILVYRLSGEKIQEINVLSVVRSGTVAGS